MAADRVSICSCRHHCLTQMPHLSYLLGEELEEKGWSSQPHSLSIRPLHESEALSRQICIPGKWGTGHPTLCVQGSHPGPGSGCLCTGRDRHCAWTCSLPCWMRSLSQYSLWIFTVQNSFSNHRLVPPVSGSQLLAWLSRSSFLGNDFHWRLS